MSAFGRHTTVSFGDNTSEFTYSFLINKEILCVSDCLTLLRTQHVLRHHFGIFRFQSLKRGERKVWGTNYGFIENGVGQFSGV